MCNSCPARKVAAEGLHGRAGAAAARGDLELWSAGREEGTGDLSSGVQFAFSAERKFPR